MLDECSKKKVDGARVSDSSYNFIRAREVGLREERERRVLREIEEDEEKEKMKKGKEEVRGFSANLEVTSSENLFLVCQ